MVSQQVRLRVLHVLAVLGVIHTFYDAKKIPLKVGCQLECCQK